MDTSELQEKVVEFRNKRDWAQYHNPKDLAISLSLEAAELLEIFQWKNAEEVEAIKSEEEALNKVREELGDIFIYSLTLAHEFNMDPSEIILNKLRINNERYPMDKVKGKSKKYNEY